jgi:hypothetical protein
MRPRALISILATLLVVLGPGPASARGPERHETTWTDEEPLSGASGFRLENLLGSVEVRGGGAPGVVRIEARVIAEAETEEQARELAGAVRLERVGDEGGPHLRVGYPVDSHASFRLPKDGQGMISRWLTPLLRKKTVAALYAGRTVQLGQSKGAVGLAVHLSVTVPHDLRTSVRQFMGSVDCELVRGDLEIENVEGKVTTGRIYGNLSARTGGGDVSVLTAKGGLVEVQTRSGGMELVDVTADELRLHTESGRIEGRKLQADALNVDADSGAVELDELDGRQLAVATGSGDIVVGARLQRTREGSIRSGSGDVRLTVGGVAPFDLRARSDSGSVKAQGTAFEIAQSDKNTASVSRGSGGADLEVHTGSGAVVLLSR